MYRQRFPVVYLLLIALSFSSCASQDADQLKMFEKMYDTFRASGELLKQQDEAIFSNLSKKSMDPQTANITARWKPAADSLFVMLSTLRKNIDSINRLLLDAGKAETRSGKLFITDNNSDLVDKFMLDKGYGEILFRHLKEADIRIERYSAKLKEYLDQMGFGTIKENTSSTAADFSRTNFKGLPVIGALAVLGRIANQYEVLAFKIVRYCDDQSTLICNLGFNSFSAIVGQSTNITSPGQDITISAGVGEFSTEAKPVITINGKLIPLALDGVADYTFKAGNKPGKHIVPVSIAYTNADGKMESKQYSIQYEVVDRK